MPSAPLMVCPQTSRASLPAVRDGRTFSLRTATALPPHALNQETPMDYIAFAAALVIGLGLLCATSVCIVAIRRAERTDVVAVVRALPELALTIARRRRR